MTRVAVRTRRYRVTVLTRDHADPGVRDVVCRVQRQYAELNGLRFDWD